jgi:hypothetical protein
VLEQSRANDFKKSADPCLSHNCGSVLTSVKLGPGEP